MQKRTKVSSRPKTRARESADKAALADWQLQGIKVGIRQADRGQFASKELVAGILQKYRSVSGAARKNEARAKRGSRAKFLRAMAKVGTSEPESRDRL